VTPLSCYARGIITSGLTAVMCRTCVQHQVASHWHLHSSCSQPSMPVHGRAPPAATRSSQSSLQIQAVMQEVRQQAVAAQLRFHRVQA
jgi:hypothetical protein